MKKILLTLSMAITMSSAWAAKAINKPITIQQSDGTLITVYLHGDEDFHWYTSADGTILLRNGNDFTPITETPETFFAKAENARRMNVMKREPVTGSPKALFPHTGSPKALVILAQYQDVAFSLADPKKSFDQYLNKAEGEQEDFGASENLNYGSVRQYFMDMSNGQYSPTFDVVGPVTLPNNMEYYGGTNDNATDEKASQLVIDACELVKNDVDFSQYDSNNDGYVDLVYVIYAGYGQSMGGANNTMWPKSFSVNTSNTYNGKKLYRSGINNELLGNESWPETKQINGIGLFVHEFSHCLGLPDFYASRLKSIYDNQGMEDWSVMDNGTYNMNGYVPAAYTAWEREAFGWCTIATLTEDTQLQIDNIDYGGKAYKFCNDNNKDEYFVIQRFQNRKWNYPMANSKEKMDGLLIYHVDYNSTDFSISSNNVNNTVGHPRMAVVPSDGILTSSYRDIALSTYWEDIKGDLYGAGTKTGKTDFIQSDAIANSKWFTEGTARNIYNIHINDDEAMWLDFGKNLSTDGIDNITANTEGRQGIYSLSGTFLGNSSANLPKGIYIIGGKKFVQK